MDFDELVEKAFSKDFLEDNKDVDLGFLESYKDEFVLTKRQVSIENILAKNKDSSFRMDNSIKRTNNGIEILYPFKDFIKQIIPRIPRTVSKLGLPLNSFDKEFFSEFPNLEELTITDYSSPKEEFLDYIYNNTKIKRINAPSMYNIYLSKDYIKESSVVIYKDIVIKNSNKNERDNTIFLNCSSMDPKLFDLFIENSSLQGVNEIQIACGDKKYEFDIKDKKIDVKITDPNIDISKEIYDYLVNRGYEVNSVSISIKKDTKDFMSEEKIDYVNMDWSNVEKLNESVEVKIGYDGAFVTTGPLDEFKGLRESVKWFKQIITDYQLSPVEKLLFAYDIMKTFKYNESKEDLFDSRHPSRIIETGHIVCVGYTALLNEILAEIDPSIKFGDFSCTCYEDDDVTVRGFHSRGVVRIDDDKYGIHGIFALDPTWDSYKEQGKEVLGDDYDALSLYHYFMIPFSDYGTVFEHDSMPSLFEGQLAALNDNLSSDMIEQKAKEMKALETSVDGELPQKVDENKIFSYEILPVLKEVKSIDERVRLFNCKRLPFEKLLDAVRTVRMAEGYSGQTLETEMAKIARINSRYYGQEQVSEFAKQ